MFGKADCLILTVVLCFVLAGCGGKSDPGQAALPKQPASKQKETTKQKETPKQRETAKKEKAKTKVATKKKKEPTKPEKQPAKSTKATQPLDSARWVLVPHKAENNAGGAGEGLELQLELTGLRAQVRAPQLHPIQLRLLERLDGDFVLTMQLHLPDRKDEEVKAAGSIPYFGFRGEDGKEVKVSGVRLQNDPQIVSLFVARSGDQLQFIVDGKPRKVISNGRSKVAGNLFLALTMPCKLWVSEYRVQAANHPAIYRSITSTPKDMIAAQKRPSPAKKKTTAGKRKAKGGRKGIPVATTFAGWELLGSFNDRQNLIIKDDVKIRREKDGIKVSKTKKSRFITLRYKHRVSEDFRITLRLLLPAANEVSRRQRGSVSAFVRPSKGSTGSGLQPGMPRMLPNERRDCVIRFQKIGQSISGEINGQNIRNPGHVTGPVDIGLLATNETHFWITDFQYEAFKGLGQKRDWWGRK